MTDEFEKMAETFRNYAEGLQEGVQTFIKALPLLINQHITTQANKKLHSTKDDYLAAISTRFKYNVLIVEIDKDDWKANAVETGVGQFNMREGLLSSPKAKISAKGYRYMSIPIGKKKGAPAADNDKSREYQDKINQILNKPIFKAPKLSQDRFGKVREMQEVVTDDPMMKGLYRTREWKSAESVHAGGKKPDWQYILFRTVSDNPLSRGKWVHPGIKPVNIFRETQGWLDANIDPLLNSFITTELKKRGIDI